jgi:hypothetical protein
VSFRTLFLSEDDLLVLGRDGWAAYYHEDVDERVAVRLADSSGRFTVVEVRVLYERGVTGRTMRQLPLARIEAAANDPSQRSKIGDAIEEGSPVIDWETADSPLQSPAFRDPWRVAQRQSRRFRRDTTRIKVPKTKRKPDRFYETVAIAFTAKVRQGSRTPAGDLAKQVRVPRTTIHRWVKEARRRGLMPKAGRGGEEER